MNENILKVSINYSSDSLLYQWDKGQILEFEENVVVGTEVLFSTDSMKRALPRLVNENNQVSIPDSILELGENITAHVMLVSDDSETTIKRINISVRKRTKPADYIEPEDEPTFREEMQAIMDETKEIAQSVRDDADNGKFDGKDYVLTEEDKEEIASMVPGGGSGTSNYNDLENKPKINGTELKGNVSLEDLGIEIPEIPEIEIPKLPNITKATYNLLTEVLDNKVWSTSGVLTDNVQFLASDYIANDGLEYSIQTKTKVSVFTARVCQFDADKKFIKAETVSGNGVSILNFTLDSNCSYFTVSVKKYQGSNVYDLTDMMVVKGHDYIIPYKPHLVIKDECLPSDLFSQICFGAEYLYSWYKKLIDGDSVKVTLLGDSTLSEAYITKEGCKKQDYIEKMLTDKGIDVTILNSAVGGTTTNELIEYSLEENRLPSDTDLIICNYGCNDWTLSGTYAERLARFKSNYETFFANLESRGFNYDNLGVIIMTPSLASNSTERYQFTFDCKKILQELAPKYHFAMLDTYKVDQDHLFTDNWSVYDDDIQAGIHPQYFMNAMLMQYLEWLVIPSGIGTVSDGKDVEIPEVNYKHNYKLDEFTSASAQDKGKFIYDNFELGYTYRYDGEYTISFTTTNGATSKTYTNPLITCLGKKEPTSNAISIVQAIKIQSFNVNNNENLTENAEVVEDVFINIYTKIGIGELANEIWMLQLVENTDGAEVDLGDYYKKNETYSSEEIDAKFEEIIGDINEVLASVVGGVE